MERATVVGLLAALVVFGSIVGPASAFGGEPLAQADVDPDSVNIAVDVREDGSAAWSIEYRVQLQSENETDAFEDIVADVENNSSAYIDRFSSRINATVAEAESDTGRTMTATDYTVSAETTNIPQTYGILRYTFVWEGFAATDGDTIRIGDSLRGFFLDEETSMVVSWPADYQASSVDPAPTDDRDNAINWEGPLEFADDEPSIVLEPVEPTTQPAETTPGVTSSAAGTTPGTDGTTDVLSLVGLVVIGLLILALVALWYYRRDEGGGSRTSESASPGDGPTGGAPPRAEDDSQPADDLLSNEERVTQFLADHGGRAKQQEIVDGLEWTEAKTSQVLTSMADEGTIEKFRIGRENVVKLPDDGGETDGDQGREA